MTKFLADLLQAKQPHFRFTINELEQAGGMPSADIRFSAEVVALTRQKIAELGLDPYDTTPQELYAVLQQRLSKDESRTREALDLNIEAPHELVLKAVATFVQKSLKKTDAFALRATTAKRLLKKHIPHEVMKSLGYRSFDSLLKHETVPHIYAATLLCESDDWHQTFRELYKKLTPSDFELRKVKITLPKTKRWEKLAETHVARERHNILYFRELGSIVVLPLPAAARVDGLAIVSLLLLLHAANELRVASSFIKLQQVNAQFGSVIARLALKTPETVAEFAGQPVPWRLIHRYYTKVDHEFPFHIFEPHLQADDLEWKDVEQVLSSLSPELSFWEGTQMCGFVGEGSTVSLNMLDVALNYCNRLPFAERIVSNVREVVWHELLGRYMGERQVEQTVSEQLQNKLVAGNLVG